MNTVIITLVAVVVTVGVGSTRSAVTTSPPEQPHLADSSRVISTPAAPQQTLGGDVLQQAWRGVR